MVRFVNWWHGLPESYRTALLVAGIGLLGWLATKGIPSLLRLIASRRKQKHEEQIELLSHKVWAYIKAQPGSATTATRTSLIVSDLKVSESEAKEALRVLKDKGLLTTTFDESLWYSDAKGRFFN